MNRKARHNLYFTEVTRDDLKTISQFAGESVNELVNVAINEYLERNREILKHARAALRERDAIMNRNK